MRTHSGLITGLFICVLLFSAGCSEGAAGIEGKLGAFAEDRISRESLEVIYDDIHGLWGGVRMLVRGDGKTSRTLVERQREVSLPPPSELSPEQVQELVGLLITIKAWEQITPDRPPIPDEARSYLRIMVGEDRTEVWEWYNEMRENDRLIRIRDFLGDAFSPTPPAAEPDASPR